MSENAPLVSVVVVTYNSAKTVVETLDSISQQTYKNIELIVSDDGSQDGTVEIVSKWVEEHKDDFVGSRVISAERNTGTVKNLNRGIMASNGFWIKSIAGDDCLFPNAIAEYLAYVDIHRDCEFCISRMKLFCSEGCVSQDLVKQWESFFEQSNVEQELQYNLIIERLTFTGPSYFYTRKIYDKVGGFDESYILMEEWPFCLNVLSLSYKIHAIDKYLVRYRISSTSVCHQRVNNLRNHIWYKDERKFFEDRRRYLMLKKCRFLLLWSTSISYCKEGILQERKFGRLGSAIYHMLSLLEIGTYKKMINYFFKK
ncbi:MAG: glycosyltransferase [Paludibacteraceae bacterium]|nr:glycosyltransferase [Paludibacteraceae bacterium]